MTANDKKSTEVFHSDTHSGMFKLLSFMQNMTLSRQQYEELDFSETSKRQAYLESEFDSDQHTKQNIQAASQHTVVSDRMTRYKTFVVIESIGLQNTTVRHATDFSPANKQKRSQFVSEQMPKLVVRHSKTETFRKHDVSQWPEHRLFVFRCSPAQAQDPENQTNTA